MIATQPDRALARASVAAIALTFCLLFWPAATRRIFLYADLGNFYLPVRMFLAENIEKGITPLWIPHLFCGFYAHGDGQIGIFHPLRWLLYRIAPISEAFNAECLGIYPVALIGVALFLRRLGLPASAALFGGITFALSGYMTARLTHPNTIAVLAHIGWLLFVIDVVLREPPGRKSSLAWVGIAVLTGSQILVGFPPALLYAPMFEIPYVLLVAMSRREVWPSLAVLGALAVGFLLGGIQLIPTLDQLASSVRADPSFEYLTEQSLHPLNVLLIVAPWLFWDRTYQLDVYNPIEQAFYFGAAAPIAWIWVLLRWKQLGRMRPVVVGLLALSVLALILSLGRHTDTDLYRLILELPVIGLLRTPARHSVVLFFAGALLAAIAFADLLSADASPEARRRSWWLWSVPALSWLVALIALEVRADPAGWGYAEVAVRLNPPRLLIVGPVLFTLAGALFFAAVRGYRAALFGLVLFSLADLSAYGADLWWSDPPRTLPEYRAHTPTPPISPPSRIWTPFDIWTFRAADGQGRFWASTPLIIHDARLISGHASLVPATRLDYSKSASLRVAGASALARIDGGFSRLPGALPRARMVTRAVRSVDPGAQIEEIDVATTALVEESVDLVAGHPGEARIQHESPREVLVVTRSESRQLLVLAESFHEGWRVTVDGEAGRVLRTNGDFMGCVVEAGTHALRFRFEPRSFEVGRRTSLAGAAIVLAGLLILYWNPARSRGRQTDGADPRSSA